MLGTVLFLVHIASIADSISPGTEASSFADVKSVADCAVLQADLLKVYEWAGHVNMHFNSDKFECLRFWGQPGDAPAHQYLAPDSVPIEVKEHLRDLGVDISSDLIFSVHIFKMVTAAFMLSGRALRSFRRKSQCVMVMIWKCLVQPKLDYCSQLWSPNN